ncbi:MAG TPA: hypothetical protein VNL35_07180 [Chloroflexota bacterium]|nr:hypothetical protein [Chloroflexota bacterium]
MSKAHKTAQAPVRQTRRLAVAPFEGFDRNTTIFLPQGLIDDQLAGLTEGELKIMLCIIRATNSGQRQGVALSVRMLCQGGVPDLLPGRGSGLSPRTVQAACAALETAGYLKVTRRSAPDGSGLPSLFSLPLFALGMSAPVDTGSPRFPGYNASRRMRLPLLVIDRLLAELSGAELRVLLYVLRHTFSQGIPDEVMPMARLVENTGLSLRHTRLAVTGLTTRGILLVQHRQDRERGKIPSRFAVPVLGEASPFAEPGVAAVKAPQPDPAPEIGRPVYLVPGTQAPPQGPTLVLHEPAPEPGSSAPTGILQVFPNPNQPLTPQAAPGAAGIAATGRRSAPSEMVRDLHPAWAAVKRILSTRLAFPIFSERIATTHGVGNGGPELLVAVENEHHRWWVETKLRDQIRQALVDAGYGDLPVRYLNYDGAIPLVPEQND